MIFTPSLKLVEAVINHPSVRPTAQSGDYRLEAGEVIGSGNLLFANDLGGVLIFVQAGPAVYDAHIFCIAGARGAAALALARTAITRLFTDHRAVLMRARAPLALPAVSFICRRLGLKPVGRDSLQEHFEVEADQWAA